MVKDHSAVAEVLRPCHFAMPLIERLGLRASPKVVVFKRLIYN